MVKYFIIALLLMVSGSAQAGDPTKPYNWQAANSASLSSSEALSLNQIITIANNTYAVINGARYQQGEVVQGYTIIDIKSNRVRLRGGNQELELRMYSSNVKRPIAVQGESQ